MTKKNQLQDAFDGYLEDLILGRQKPVPIPPDGGRPGKAPKSKDWQEKAGTQEARALLDEGWNLGLLVGGGTPPLVVVDNDCKEAVQAAPFFLTPTERKTWRVDTENLIHWWYLSEGEPPRSAKLGDPREQGNGRSCLVELIGVKASGGPGRQVVIPPSIHPSGARYCWLNPDGEPARVAAEDLVRRVHRVGAAALLRRHGWRDGQRHNLCLAIAGAMADAGHVEADGLDLLTGMAAAFGDPGGVEQAVRDTFAKKDDEDAKTTGAPTVAKLVGEDVAKAIMKFLTVGYGVEEPDEGKEAMPPREKIIGILSNAREPLSMQALVDRMKISDRMLRKHLAAERDGENRVRAFQRGRLKYLALRRGSGMVAVSWDAPVRREMKEAVSLPPGFRSYVGPRNGLPANSFVVFQAGPDGYKTAFLLATALANAEAGRLTHYVTHEHDEDAIRQMIARQLLGRSPASAEEARDACLGTNHVRENLRLLVVPGVAQVDEFAEEILALDPLPATLVYDYMNQSLIKVDHDPQESKLAAIAQRLGQGLVDRGVPVITATQLVTTPKGTAHAPDTWIQRATVVLRAERIEVAEGGKRRDVHLRLVKNKAGHDRWTTKHLVMEVEEDSHRVLGVKPAAEEVLARQEEILAQLPDEFSEDELNGALKRDLGANALPEARRRLINQLEGAGRIARVHGADSRWEKRANVVRLPTVMDDEVNLLG